jgi:Zn-dependent membrane protease YugP
MATEITSPKIYNMETLYTAYTKMLDYKMYYFIKKFSAFPEFKNVSPVLESYGMHTDFDKACSIAGVNDTAVKEQLLQQVQENTPRAKVIELSNSNFAEKSVAG